MVLTVEEYLRCASGASSFPEEAGQPLATGLYDALHIKSTIVLIIIIVVAVLIIIIAWSSSIMIIYQTKKIRRLVLL